MPDLSSWAALVVAILALWLNFRKDVLIVPRVEYTVEQVTKYPASPDVSLAVKRVEVPGSVELKRAVVAHIWSAGHRPASSVQVRASATGGAYFVAVHADDEKLVQPLPDLRRQASSEVFVTIPRMVPREEVRLTYWYGIPDAPNQEPPFPNVIVGHADGLGRRVKAPGRS